MSFVGLGRVFFLFLGSFVFCFEIRRLLLDFRVV